MISSVLDYKFVTGNNVDEDHPHGDLDRILIDGSIYPKRQTAVVRGEDAAFLIEGMCERGYVSPTNRKFSRVISPKAINLVRDLGSQTKKWIPKDAGAFQKIHWAPSSEELYWHTEKMAEIYGSIYSSGPSSISSWQAYDAIETGEALRIAPLRKAFANLNICRKCVETFAPEFNYKSQWTKSVRYYDNQGDVQTETDSFGGSLYESVTGQYRNGEWTVENSYSKDVSGVRVMDTPSHRTYGLKHVAGVKSTIIVCADVSWSHNVNLVSVESGSFHLMYPLSVQTWGETEAAFLTADDINNAYAYAKGIAESAGLSFSEAAVKGSWGVDDPHSQTAYFGFTLYYGILEINELSGHTKLD